MVNDPTVERENIGGNQPIGDPAETGPTTTEGGGDESVEEAPEER
jgi:hypothetical protein